MRHISRLVFGVVAALAWLGPDALPGEAAPFAYIVNSPDSIAVVDIATNTVVATVPVGRGALGTAVHPAGTFAYVTNYWDETVSVVDTATNGVVATVPVPPGPLSLALHPTGRFVYVAHEAHVTVIDTATNRVVTSIAVAVTLDTPTRGIAVHPAGTFVYVANDFDATVSVISTATNSIVATVPTSTRPSGIAVHPAGTFVYVINAGFFIGPGGHSLSVIDAATNSEVATVPIGGLPFGVAVHPAGTFVYVTDFATGSVSVVATASNAVVATVPVASTPVGVAVHPAGTFVYVTHGSSKTMSVITTATNAVVAAIAVPGSFVSAFGHFIGPSLPGVSLTLNEARFGSGELLTLVATTYAGERTDPLDAYLELRLPDGAVLFAQQDGRFTTERRPLVGQWTVQPFSREIFKRVLSGGEPPGRYTWRAYFTEPGAPDVVGPVGEVTFDVGL